VQYYCRYTDFFGRTGKHAWITRTPCSNTKLAKAIQSWQQPILDREDCPTGSRWRCLMSFTTLLAVAHWVQLISDSLGRFAVLECIDYRWYEA